MKRATFLRAVAWALAGGLLAAGPVAAKDPGLSPAEFAKLSRELRVKGQPWAGVPWQVSVTEARAEAACAEKPIFLVVNTGNCLGFV